MTYGQNKGFRAFFILLISLLLASLTSWNPANAEPDLKTAKATADALYEEAEQASERYNAIKTQITAAELQLSGLAADQKLAKRKLSSLQKKVARMVLSEYQNTEISTAASLVLAKNPDAFLDNLHAYSSFQQQQNQTMQQATQQIDLLGLRQNAVTKQQDFLARLEKELAAEKATIDKKSAEAKAVLSKLQAKELAKLQTGNAVDPALLSSLDGSGRGMVALRYALAQVGKAYVWGAAGPNSFDCSGLTMAAWARAGVGLPHSSSAQRGAGVFVPANQLQPGDLVFYYSPIHHVGIYMGDGKIVHASNPRVGVVVSPLYSMPYVGAVRPG